MTAPIGGRLTEKRRYLRLAVLREVHQFLTSDDASIDDEAAALGLDQTEIDRAWATVANEVDRKLMAARPPILDGDPLDHS